MDDMAACLRRLPGAQRRQYAVLVAVRSLSGCAKSVAELVQADLFLRLNGHDFARTARILSGISTCNTLSDFCFAPVMGSVIDAYGRRRCLLAAQLADGATALLVGLRPSVWSFVAWQLLREFSRRANKPARMAMLGDLVGRASTEFVHLHNLSESVSEAARIIAMLIVARTGARVHREHTDI